jgi:hypothetical protein
MDSCITSADHSSQTTIELIRGLCSLPDGRTYVDRLLSSGNDAIHPLRQFLLYESVPVAPQARCWAVEALAGLGAKDVLMDYLEQSLQIHESAKPQGEEHVWDAAVRELAVWRLDAVFLLLLKVAARRCSIAVIEAVSGFCRPESIPCLIEALGHDRCRSAAIRGLRELGSAAAPMLIETALNPRMSCGRIENPCSLRRRRAALRLLAGPDLSSGNIGRLGVLLREDDAEVVLATCQLLAGQIQFGDRQALRKALRGIEPGASWYLKGELHDLLFRLENAIGDFQKAD